MPIKCSKCTHINNNPNSQNTCETCGHVLPPPSQKPVENSRASKTRSSRSAARSMPRWTSLHAKKPHSTERKPTGAKPQPGRPAPSLPVRSPGRSRFGPPAPANRTTLARQPALPATQRSTRPAPRPADPNMLTGTIVRIDPLNPERPDPNIARILFALLLVADLTVLTGGLFLVFIIIALIIAAISMAVGSSCTFGLLQIISRMILSFVGLLIPSLMRNREPQNLVPVNNFLLRTTDGRNVTFRIKEQLRGATPQLQDRVQIRGSVRHGILHFRAGNNLDTDEAFELPPNRAWIWLAILAILNVIFFSYLWSQWASLSAGF
jgi:hypothetical protein